MRAEVSGANSLADEQRDELIAANRALRAGLRERRRAEKMARGQAEALAKMLNLLATEPQLDKFVGQVLQVLTEQLGAWSGCFWLQDGEPGTLLHYSGSDGCQCCAVRPNGSGEPCVHPCTHLGPLRIDKLSAHTRPRSYEDVSDAPFPETARRALAGIGVKTVVVVPLILGATCLGIVVMLYCVRRKHRADELRLAQALAHQAVLALQLTRLAEQNRESSVLEERNRIAREIHDTLAQAFTGMLLHLRVAERIRTSCPDEAWDLIGQVGDLAQTGLAEARRSVWSLQPEDPGFGDLPATLGEAVGRMAGESGVPMECHIQGVSRPLPLDVGLDLLRIAQESMMNAVRHAKANLIWIELTFEPHRVLLRIQDDGRGFVVDSVDGRGFGLISMGQRAERLGGRLSISSRLGHGTEVAVEVPLVPAKERNDNP